MGLCLYCPPHPLPQILFLQMAESMGHAVIVKRLKREIEKVAEVATLDSDSKLKVRICTSMLLLDNILFTYFQLSTVGRESRKIHQ